MILIKIGPTPLTYTTYIFLELIVGSVVRYTIFLSLTHQSLAAFFFILSYKNTVAYCNHLKIKKNPPVFKTFCKSRNLSIYFKISCFYEILSCKNRNLKVKEFLKSFNHHLVFWPVKPSSVLFFSWFETLGDACVFSSVDGTFPDTQGHFTTRMKA